MNQQIQPKQPTGWRKFLAKRWLYPALYVAVASLMLVMMWVYQNQMTDQTTDQAIGTAQQTESKVAGENQTSDNSDQAVTGPTPSTEKMIWPYEENQGIEIAVPFFEKGAPAATREKAMIEYEQTFTPHTGLDFSRKDKQTFAVYSAMSGTVSRVEKHPLLGNLLEITHANGLVTVYQSLGQVDVTMRQEVRQGQRIGQAGRNEFEKHLAVHLHFEVRQHGKPVNPANWIPKTN